MADGCFGALSQALAPDGYAYLLVQRGRGTVAAYLSSHFHDEKASLERTVDFFQRHAGLRWRQPTPFGGSGNISLESALCTGSLYYAGESAGLQDALFGFGLRYAMLSGHFAARAWLVNASDTYERLCRNRLRKHVQAGIANRRLYRLLGDRGRQFVLDHWPRDGDPRRLLERIYRPNPLKILLGATAPRRLQRRTVRSGCDCTWCRCHSEPCAGKQRS